MNRKDFLKTIIGFTGVLVTIPAVLIARDKPAVSDFIYAKARRSGRESTKFGMPLKDKDYHIEWARKCYRDYIRRHPLPRKECYTRGFWQQIEAVNIKSHKYKSIDFEKFLLYE